MYGRDGGNPLSYDGAQVVRNLRRFAALLVIVLDERWRDDDTFWLHLRRTPTETALSVPETVCQTIHTFPRPAASIPVEGGLLSGEMRWREGLVV
jgi:hypothetical protein